MSRNRNRILNTAGLTGGAQCSAATERKDGQGGVSSLLLMVDFRGGPVWHLENFVILGEAQSMYFNFLARTRGGPVGIL